MNFANIRKIYGVLVFVRGAYFVIAIQTHVSQHLRHVSALNSNTTTEVLAGVVVELHSASEAEATKQSKRFDGSRVKSKGNEYAKNMYQGGVHLTRGWDEIVLVFCLLYTSPSPRD